MMRMLRTRTTRRLSRRKSSTRKINTKSSSQRTNSKSKRTIDKTTSLNIEINIRIAFFDMDMAMVMMAMGVTTMVALETGKGGLGPRGEEEDQGELPVHGELACLVAVQWLRM